MNAPEKMPADPCFRNDGNGRGLRPRAGLILGPVLFLGLWLAPIAGLPDAAHRMLAILALVVTFWLTEPIPMPVTALLGPTLCVAFGIGTAKDVFRSFADPIIFLFIGSFVLAEGMLRHGLNHRIAFQILALKGVGTGPGRLLLAYAAVTGFISMWISNTATTAMMLPIGISILTEMARRRSEETGCEVKFTGLKYGTGLMLMASFASSVGGLATPVGTPPNLIGIGILKQQLHVNISFFQWMAFGLPLAVVVIGILVVYFNRVFCADRTLAVGAGEWIRAKKEGIGPVTRAQGNVLFAFGCTIFFWVLPGVIALAVGEKSEAYSWFNRRLPEGVVAIMGASLLFFLPVSTQGGAATLTWKDAARIDWGTILLFGGGLALGELMFSTGLARWIGDGLVHLTHAKTVLGLTALFAGIAILVSETTSNTASATMVTPVAIAVAQSAGVDPVAPSLAACLGASFGFMLPVSTAPNAMVYGSGCVPLAQMIRYGILLDVVGWVAVVAVVMGLAPMVLGR